MEDAVSLDQLQTDQWVLDLDDDARRAYARMRTAERNWAGKLVAAGCEAISRSSKPDEDPDHPTRGGLLLVPPHLVTTELVDVDQLTEAFAAWAAITHQLAREQGKAETIGSRSATVPYWLGPGGSRQAEPGQPASRVTYRYDQAARGARITAEDAIKWLRGRVAWRQECVNNSVQNGQRARAERQAEKLEEARNALTRGTEILHRALAERRPLSAQVLSGEALRVHVLTEGGGYTATVPTWAMVAVKAGVAAEPARRRTWPDDGWERVQLGSLRILIGPAS
jgi:hypothetical protein